MIIYKATYQLLGVSNISNSKIVKPNGQVIHVLNEMIAASGCLGTS